MWITVVPMTFVGITTITGGILNMINLYIPQMLTPDSRIQGTINTVLTGLILICVVLIILEAIPKWMKKTGKPGPSVRTMETEIMGSDKPLIN
jgi:carbon starvation protein CstA